jgi:hypothetical protein
MSIKVGWYFTCNSNFRGKQKNRLNRENQKKNNQKNRTMKKNRLEFLQNRPVRFGFGFISLKLKKPNRTQTKKNLSQIGKKTESNRTKPEPVGLNRFLF